MKTDLEKLNDLSCEWILAKKYELVGANKRREIEDEILNITNHNSNTEGSEIIDTEEYNIMITNRIDRKVNHSILEEIVKENDLNSSAQDLFRWKPEVNMREWKKSHKEITDQFRLAIESKPGKPSFKITQKE